LSLPIMVGVEFTISKKIKGYQPIYHLLHYLTPVYFWCLIFFLQPHKEERFLYPMYPPLMLSAAIAVGSIQKIYACFLQKKVKIPFAVIGYLSMGVSGLFGFARLCALVLGYSGVLDTYRAFYQKVNKNYDWISDDMILCIGKEWHRFPSSFYIPRNVSTKIIQSEFRGQLPAHFGDWPHGISDTPRHFNDNNKEEKSLYHANPTNVHKKCDFLVDSDFGVESEWEPLYHMTQVHWEVLYEADILHKEKSHWFHRAFYIPFYYHENVKMGKYRLLRNKVKPLVGGIKNS